MDIMDGFRILKRSPIHHLRILYSCMMLRHLIRVSCHKDLVSIKLLVSEIKLRFNFAIPHFQHQMDTQVVHQVTVDMAGNLITVHSLQHIQECNPLEECIQDCLMDSKITQEVNLVIQVVSQAIREVNLVIQVVNQVIQEASRAIQVVSPAIQEVSRAIQVDSQVIRLHSLVHSQAIHNGAMQVFNNRLLVALAEQW